MRPPSAKLYKKHNVSFVKFTLNDHTPLTTQLLIASADAIHDGLQRGDVYVHCKAGQGRSAQAVLAYFVKHEGYSVDTGVVHMKKHRPGITLVRDL